MPAPKGKPSNNPNGRPPNGYVYRTFTMPFDPKRAEEAEILAELDRTPKGIKGRTCVEKMIKGHQSAPAPETDTTSFKMGQMLE